ncbi:hypothetical protein FQA39_LY12924 [Lamprigera yunnana]|nr:hypothetical protein FQA39_LY12924 [Lamprigera yunnana]
MKKSEVKTLLKERNSAKSFKTDFNISDEQLIELGDIIRFSPVSMGLFSTRLVIFQTRQLKDTFNSAFYDQVNYKTASAVILFCTDLEERILIIQFQRQLMDLKGHISDERIEARKNYVATSLGGYSQKTVDKLARENNLIENNEQVAIALVIGKNNDNPEIYLKID